MSEKRHHHISEYNEIVENPYIHNFFYILRQQLIKKWRHSDLTFFLISKGLIQMLNLAKNLVSSQFFKYLAKNVVLCQLLNKWIAATVCVLGVKGFAKSWSTQGTTIGSKSGEFYIFIVVHIFYVYAETRFRFTFHQI